MTRKSRTFISVTARGRKRPTIFHGWGDYVIDGPVSSEVEETMSHAHLEGRWSGGGAWFLTRDTYAHQKGISADPNLWEGELFLQSYGEAVTEVPAYPTMTTAQSLIDGTHAINATAPTIPTFSMAQAIGELRADGLPSPAFASLWRDRTRICKDAGDEYLNGVFGWLPLVNDINKFAYAVDNADRIVNAYQRDANKSMKRSFSWPVDSDSQSLYPVKLVGNPASILNDGFVFRTVEKRRWFEADYIYYLPVGGSVADKMRRYGSYARKLFGIGLTPDVLWNLAPWSWAADWYGNVGEVMSNVSAFGTDGLVMRHAFLMCHTRAVTDWIASYSGSTVVRRRIEENKQRFPASPYGFGVTFESLTARQAAVVAALGLSRW